MKEKLSHNAQWLTVCALLMAINIAFSSFGLPVPGGHLYMNDVVIVAAALSLDPLGAFMVGGIGAFLGDFFFYPAPMFVSLATHGLQAVVIATIARRTRSKALAFGGVLLGAAIMITGYTLGRAYVYSTPEYSMIKLPYEILQALLGVCIGTFLAWKWDMPGMIRHIINKGK